MFGNSSRWVQFSPRGVLERMRGVHGAHSNPGGKLLCFSIVEITPVLEWAPEVAQSIHVAIIAGERSLGGNSNTAVVIRQKGCLRLPHTFPCRRDRLDH